MFLVSVVETLESKSNLSNRSLAIFYIVFMGFSWALLSLFINVLTLREIKIP